MSVMSMRVYISVVCLCKKTQAVMPAIQETMKKGISSLSTNPTGQQIISIINAVAISTFRTTPLTREK